MKSREYRRRLRRLPFLPDGGIISVAPHGGSGFSGMVLGGMMKRISAIFLLGWLLVGCGNKEDPFDILQYATAVPGEGLGELRLGVERLGGFVDRFGMGQPSVAFTDEEITAWVFYPEQQLHFIFLFNGPCYQATRMQGPRVARQMFDPPAFFASYPQCRDAPLNSILIGTNNRGEGWWKGSTRSGSRLGDVWPDVLVTEGVPQQHGDAYLPLMQTQRLQLESLNYWDGMEVYFVYLQGGQTEEDSDRLAMQARYIDIRRGHDW